MSNSIVPLSAGLPAYLRSGVALANINKEVAVGAAYGRLSIKGKVFCLVKDGEKKMLMRPDEPDEVAQSISLVVVRANTKARSYYDKSFVEGGESDGARPACYSYDGVAPAPDSQTPQAKKCAVCQQAVWGTKMNDKGEAVEGTSCSPHTRMCVIDPDKPEVQLLLSAPAASRKNFAAVVKACDGRSPKIPYNAVVLRVGFDPEAASPKLTFKPIGFVSDATYAKVTELYDSDMVKDICGINPPVEALAAPAPAAEGVDMTDLDAALATKAAVAKAAAPAKPKAKPVAPPPAAEADPFAADEPAPAPAPVKAAAKPAAKPVAAPAADMDNLLGELGDLLGSKDD